MTNDTVVWFEEVGKEDIAIVGGKGVSQCEMLRAELPASDGFAATSQAFQRFINENEVNNELFSALEANVDDADIFREAEKKDKKIIMEAKMPHDIEKSIWSKYRKLCKREGYKVFMAVHSSATAENPPDVSFAGQQNTLLNIRGDVDKIKAVKKCWNPLYAVRAIYYSAKQGFDHKVNFCAAVQRIVDIDRVGVMFFELFKNEKADASITELIYLIAIAIIVDRVMPDNLIVGFLLLIILVLSYINIRLYNKLKGDRSVK